MKGVVIRPSSVVSVSVLASSPSTSSRRRLAGGSHPCALSALVRLAHRPPTSGSPSYDISKTRRRSLDTLYYRSFPFRLSFSTQHRPLSLASARPPTPKPASFSLPIHSSHRPTPFAHIAIRSLANLHLSMNPQRSNVILPLRPQLQSLHNPPTQLQNPTTRSRSYHPKLWYGDVLPIRLKILPAKIPHEPSLSVAYPHIPPSLPRPPIPTHNTTFKPRLLHVLRNYIRYDDPIHSQYARQLIHRHAYLMINLTLPTFNRRRNKHNATNSKLAPLSSDRVSFVNITSYKFRCPFPFPAYKFKFNPISALDT
ncbi:hypothetical protein R3P38DRAFT_3277526 [Favolaschia claudopus]|uniref:Uncharacterized protein n=1 Tax=Favolaschia claudopus TaxID=2862362 RepID=A0AAW0AMH9_9AGAR